METKKLEGIRINKFLSEAGYCSRRQADELITQGKVKIDQNAAVMGDRVLPGQRVFVDGKELTKEEETILLAFYKPRGIVCTTSKKDKDNIIDYIGYPTRIYPVGRLDKDSEGLIFLTNQGHLMDQILRARNKHEKEYIVKVNRPISEDFLKGMANGVPILDTVTRRCHIEKIDEKTFRIILTQGLNRQIRRMCEYFQYKVLELKRVRIMNVHLGKLKVGQYRKLSAKELEELKKLL